MIEKLIEKLSRRGFLSRLSAAAAAVVCSIVGIRPNTVRAGVGVDVFCCFLCQNSNPTCSGGACSWCWYCKYMEYLEPQVDPGGGPEPKVGIRCSKYQCVERYTAGPCDSPVCTNIKCSRAVFKGTISCSTEVLDRPCIA
jgi:hypothetical protein